MQGGITSQTQPPYILTHFPGCENSHQGAGRCEEQVAAPAETLRALRYSPWEELFVLGLSAVCCEGSRGMERLACWAHLLLGQTGRGDRKCHLISQISPQSGGLRGHSSALVEKPKPAGEAATTLEPEDWLRLATVSQPA